MAFFSDDTKDKFRKFRRIRRAWISLWIIVAAFILSLFAEFLANDRPIVLVWKDSIYFPVYKTYKGVDFGLKQYTEPNYKNLNIAENGWAIWPLVEWGPNETNDELESYPAPPSTANQLGTDDRGRDVFTRLVYGFRVSVSFGLFSLFISVILAVIIGGLQGYAGGRIDFFGQRVVEIWNSLPYLYVLILLVNIYEPGLLMLIVVNSCFSWIALSYYVRAEVLKVRKNTYVTAATAMGCKTPRILARHIVPNSLTPIITFAPFLVNLAINNLAVLDYLGLGVPPPTASIGELLRQGKSHFTTSWWLAVYPFTILVGLIVTINFVGEGLREAFDPRKSRA